MNIEKGLNNKILAAITDVKLNIEHIKSASLVAKGARAEALAESSVHLMELFAQALGVEGDQ